MKVPTILADNKILTLDTSTASTIEILKFADERRKLDVSAFLPRHVETLAQVFKTTNDVISRNLTPAQVITTFLDVLTYVANVFTKIAKEFTIYHNKPRRYIEQVLGN